MIVIPLDVGQLNQIETRLCYLVCAVSSCAVYDDCDVMLACLVLVIVCLYCLSIRRERCRSLRGRRLLRAAGTPALC